MAGLLDDSTSFRDQMMAKNKYTKNEYGIGHPDALSDGDELGRGETTTIGTSVDIETRDNTLKRNRYNINKEYGIDNL